MAHEMWGAWGLGCSNGYSADRATETHRYRHYHIATWVLQAQVLRSSDVNLHRDIDAQDKGRQGDGDTGTQGHTERRLTMPSNIYSLHIGSCSEQGDVVV